MDLLTLVRTKGINPKRVAGTHGGEYHSACPSCGGKDDLLFNLIGLKTNVTDVIFAEDARRKAILFNFLEILKVYLGEKR